jgi:hypothetical protein
MNPALQYLIAMTPAIPMLAVTIIGIVLGIYRRKAEPLASRLVIFGLGALAANVLGSSALHIYAQQSFDRYQDASIHARHLAEFNAILYALHLAGFALITAAVFANRAPARADA